MRLCSVCAEEKPLEEFAKKSSMCKLCHRAYNREHYRNNKQVYLDKARRNDAKRKKESREYLVSYFSTHPCIDCGENDLVVLDFDHIDPKEKDFTISLAISNGLSLSKIKLEIDKCEVRCANCHRRRTAKQFSWWNSADVYPLATNELKG